MKREIEFRGRTSKGEWVYGDLLNLHNGDKYIVNNKFGACIDDKGNFINTESPFVCKVIPETVGQYVGIADKNGKKVYVGDIVYCSYHNCEVVFGLYGVGDYKTVGFFMKVNEALFTDEEDNFVYWGFEDSDKIEVLGNVFDNPELLNKIEYKGRATMEIKKCPFCGGTAYFNRYVDKDENEEYHDFVRVRCSQCDCRSGSVKYNATIHGIDGEYVEVAQKWNRRVDDGK